MIDKFDKYINNLRETVKESPTTDKEKGFQMAVVIIHEMYKKHKLNENI